MTSDWSRRSRRLLGAVLLLTLLYAQRALAAGNPCLVLVSYAESRLPAQAVPEDLHILHCQSGQLAALADEAQIEYMRSAGLAVQVLDPDPQRESYYLAYPPEGAGAAVLGAVETYCYDENSYLVSAETAAVERLAQAGVDVVKLPLTDKWACALSPLESPPEQARFDAAFNSEIQSMLEAVSLDSLVQYVCKLQDDDALDYCNVLGSRYSYNTAELDQAASYLYGQLSAMGLAVSYDPFSYNGREMKNVVAELPGTDSQSESIYLICAHYDSISEDAYGAAPGADDNASGSAAVLEAARILGRHRFSHTLRFVLFAGEEQGLIGSAHYAALARNQGDSIAGVINLDMIGYESLPPGDHRVELHAGLGSASNALADAMIAAISSYGIELAPEKITYGATSRSDHASFWGQGYPAVLGIEDMQDFNPHYHSTQDTLGNMQTSLMLQFTRAAVATLAGLAGPVSEPAPTATPTFTSTPSTTATPTQSATPTFLATLTETPTAVATPTPEQVTLTLQEGLNGYFGADDTYIYAYAPTANYCSHGQLQVGYKQQNAVLLGFDLTPIPAGSGIDSACLQLYVTGWSGSDVTIAAHALLRDVDWCAASWQECSHGCTWGLPGAADVIGDRRACVEGSVTTRGIRRWYALDLTALVREWSSGALANRGVLLRSGSSPALAYLASAENDEPKLRPKLEITYRSGGNPVATPTPTTSPTLTATATPSATSTGGEVTVTLQQGANGFEGAEDTVLYQWLPDTPLCQEVSLQVGYKQQSAALLTFALDAMPTTVQVIRATLQLWATGWGAQNVTLGAYRVLRANEPRQVTWESAGGGVPWGLPGCNAIGSDRRAEADSSVTTSGIKKWYSLDVTPLVRAWLDRSLENHGVLVRATYSLGVFYFASAESSMTDRRPRLVITYR